MRSGPKTRPWVLALAAVAFVAAFVLGVRGLPEPEGDRGLRPGLLVLVAVLGVPATAAVNAAEFAVGARRGGHRVRAADALRVAVLGSAANLLPLPGAALVRARELRRLGQPWAGVAAATIAVGAAWAGTAAAAAGALLVGAEGGLAATLLVAGAAGLAVAGALLRDLALLLRLVVVEAAGVAVGAARYAAVLAALGQDVDAGQATALTLAQVLSSAAGVVPGGLGLREAVAAGIAPLVELPAAAGAAAAAVDRLVALPVLALAAVALIRTASEYRGSGPVQER